MEVFKMTSIAAVPCAVYVEKIGDSEYQVSSPNRDISAVVSVRMINGDRIKVCETIRLTSLDKERYLLLWVPKVTFGNREVTLLANLSNKEWMLLHDLVRIWMNVEIDENSPLHILRYTPRIITPRNRKQKLIPPQGPQGFALNRADVFSPAIK